MRPKKVSTGFDKGTNCFSGGGGESTHTVEEWITDAEMETLRWVKRLKKLEKKMKGKVV